jgi:hypothetical protein
MSNRTPGSSSSERLGYCQAPLWNEFLVKQRISRIEILGELLIVTK